MFVLTNIHSKCHALTIRYPATENVFHQTDDALVLFRAYLLLTLVSDRIIEKIAKIVHLFVLLEYLNLFYS